MLMFWPVAVVAVDELLIGGYALMMLQNYRQFYAAIDKKPRRSIIIGYKVVIGLAVVGALFILAMPWLIQS